MKLRKPLAALAVAATVSTAGGVAYAVWSTGGSGNGYAKADTAQNLILTAPATLSGQLVPGSSGDLVLRISNPNRYPVKVTSVTQTAGSTITSGIPTCDESTGVTFLGSVGTFTVAGLANNATVLLPGRVTMSNASDNSCQGATFTIPVTLVGESAA